MSYIEIQSPDNNGTFKAYVAQPKTDNPAPAVIVIQEIFGINGVMREICDNLAQSGYLAVCPDLFWRLEPGIELTDKTQEEWDQAFDLFNRFDVDQGVEDLKAALSHVRKMENCNGKVGDIGYCLGGKLAYLMATRSDADCSVGYYGVDLVSFLDEAKNIEDPLLLHMATDDQFTPGEDREKIKNELKRYDLVTLMEYEGQDHAFAREGGEHYDSEAATLANTRTADFLATYLGTGD